MITTPASSASVTLPKAAIPAAGPAGKPATFADEISRAHSAIGWSLFGYRDDEVGYSLDQVVQGANLANQHLAAALRTGGGTGPATNFAQQGIELINKALEISPREDVTVIPALEAADQAIFEAWKATAPTS
jgi:hypothetical protein